jgi:hypothetical protein
VVSGTAHDRCNFVVEIVCDLVILLSIELNHFVFVNYARYRLDITRSGSSKELHESPLVSSTNHFVYRELSFRNLRTSVSLNLFSEG